MLYLKWFLMGFISIPVNILAKLFCWVFPFFVQEDTKRLPKWLDWFMTPNSSADGDPAHQQRHPGTSWWATYKRRTAWFWRNSAYGFDRKVLGVEVYEEDVMRVKGNPNANRRPYIPGTCMRKLYSKNGKFKAWFYYFVKPWPFGLFPKRCIRGSIGWKLWCKESQGKGIAMWTGMINPFFHRD